MLVSFVFIFASLLLLGLNSASVATTVCKSSENQGKIRSIFPNRSIDHYHILKLTEIPVSFSEARKKFIKDVFTYGGSFRRKAMLNESYHNRYFCHVLKWE